MRSIQVQRDTNERRRKLLIGGSVALAATSGLVLQASLQAQGANRYGIQGQEAPEIKLDYWIDREGKPTTFSVTENRGKWVFLKCFQDWCPGCHSSGFPTLRRFSDEFAENPKVAIAGIQTVFEGFSSNTKDDVRKNQLRYKLPITMGHDPGDAETHRRPQTMRKYRTGGTPWLIVIAPDGRVIFNHFRVNTEKLIEYIRAQVA